MAYNGQSRDPSAVDTRRSSSDAIVVPPLVTIAITALVLAGILLFCPREPRQCCRHSVGPAVTQLTEPSPPTPQTQRGSRPTPSSDSLVSAEGGNAGQTPVLSWVLSRSGPLGAIQAGPYISVREQGLVLVAQEPSSRLVPSYLKVRQSPHPCWRCPLRGHSYTRPRTAFLSSEVSPSGFSQL